MQILAYRLPEFQEIINKFNKKATKWGLPLVDVQVSEPRVEKREIHSRIDGEDTVEAYRVEVVDVEIQGEVPKLSGWEIHSKVQPSETKGQNYVFTVHGHEQVESLRTIPMFCDHCKTRRLKLTAYYIENKGEGKTMMVGASCLQDFLPGHNIEQLLSYLDNFKELSNWKEEGEVPRDQWVCDLRQAILDCYVAICKFGFVSKQRAIDSEGELHSTASWALTQREDRENLYRGVDVEEAKKAVEGFIPHMLAKPDGDDFIHNLKLCLKAESIRPKLLGYLAAGINQWQRETIVKEPDTRLNEHFGAEGQRYEFKEMKVIRLNHFEGQYGTTWIYAFNDPQGREYTWFGSNHIADEGETVNIKGTVVGHEEYKGRKQTILKRCSLMK